ncbi:guanine deaminase [Afifella sp. IM 167]|uniref:guanine deaminase n=1 Tax=Afifella sp. IM 167 TaxID=2033586 RepID=UPI001CCA4DBB|nr:guanine deaminase [Afifella sp. IM 167]MBZ8135095.1 guanine deaminase [Afifella sp. IM 167]
MIGSARFDAIRGRLLWFEADPVLAGEGEAVRYVEDGLLVLRDGRIESVGEAGALLKALPAGARIADYRPYLVMPGFIDPHLHMPQTQVIASYGAHLLEWLEKYTFVEEQRYADAGVAAAASRFLLDELLRSGTTSAAVYCSVHPASAEALFSQGEARGMRLVAGKVMMDRAAPAALLDTPQKGYDETKALIARWHERGRLSYAITPRFAVTSSEAQLEAAGALAAEYPGMHIQTHLSENQEEIETVARDFPWSEDYTAVYERYGLVRKKALFGHCIHLSPRERQALGEAGAAAIACPTSNLFLGSGLFDLVAMRRSEPPVRVGLATDIGGGTSYSMLQTAAAFYKVLALKDERLTPFEAFHMLTLGNAEALGLEGRIGTFRPRVEADLVVLDNRATPAMAQRMERVETLFEELFVLMMMGDDRSVAATCLMGAEAYRRP